MSESEKPEKNDGVTAMSGGTPADGASTLPAKEGGKMSRMKASVKKLYHAVAPYVGDLAESKRVMAAGFALQEHSKGVAKFGDAYTKLSKQFGPEKAEQMLGASPETLSLRHRAGTRLLHMEEQRQQNIESVASQAAQKIPEKVSEESVKPDWTARFIESVKDVSDETMQSLWSSILAGEVASPGQTSLRTLDVLKNLSQQDAQEFERVLQFSMSGGGVYYPMGDNRKVALRILPYHRKIHMEECGLIHHETALAVVLQISEVERFILGNFVFGMYPKPPQRGFSVEIPTFSISSAGREIARVIPAKFPELWYIRALVEFFADHNIIVRVEGSLSPMAIKSREFGGIKITGPRPGDEANISPTATDEELRAMLENCPRQTVLE